MHLRLFKSGLRVFGWFAHRTSICQHMWIWILQYIVLVRNDICLCMFGACKFLYDVWLPSSRVPLSFGFNKYWIYEFCHISLIYYLIPSNPIWNSSGTTTTWWSTLRCKLIQCMHTLHLIDEVQVTIYSNSLWWKLLVCPQRCIAPVLIMAQLQHYGVQPQLFLCSSTCGTT